MIWNTEENGIEDTNLLTTTPNVDALFVEQSTEDGEKATPDGSRDNPEPDSTPSIESLEDTEPEEWAQDTDLAEYGIQNMDRKPDGVRTH